VSGNRVFAIEPYGVSCLWVTIKRYFIFQLLHFSYKMFVSTPLNIQLKLLSSTVVRITFHWVLTVLLNECRKLDGPSFVTNKTRCFGMFFRDNQVIDTTLCLKKCTTTLKRYSSKLYESVSMTFAEIFTKLYCRIEFACSIFHVGLLVITLSSLNLQPKITHACYSLQLAVERAFSCSTLDADLCE